MSDNPVPFVVLVVDDEPACLRLVERSLEGAPFDLVIANGAKEALAVLAQRHVDVVVSDVDMPEMNGLELMKVIRAAHPAIVRIIITGNATMEKALHAINEGEVQRFFAKPFRADLFLEAMESLRERVERQREDSWGSWQASRRSELLDWMENRFPGSTKIDHTPQGDAICDLHALVQAVDATGLGSVRDLLRREG